MNPSELVISTRNLTMYYGRHRGIVDLNLEVLRGEVFGFLGPNGAGKTTTERILLDVIRPTSGVALMFGLDCRTRGVEARARVGYLPGELKLYDQMKGDRFLSTIATLRGQTVDSTYRRELCERLEVDPSRRIGEYSRGNKQKIGIVSAFMAKPDLLILDEPTTGLDPLKQQTVLDLVREAKDEGRTVFFSSHMLPEVQHVCDRVGIIRDGRLIATQRIEEMTRQRFKRLEIVCKNLPPVGAFDSEGVTELDRTGRKVSLEVQGNLELLIERALEYGIEDIETHPVTLEEVFLAFYGEEMKEGASAQTTSR